MKDSMKHFFPLIRSALCLFFGISIFFYGLHNQPHGIFSDIGDFFSTIGQTNISTSVAEQIHANETELFPSLNYVGNTLTVGEPNALYPLFMLHSFGGILSPLKETSDTALYLIDVKSVNGASVLTKLTTTDIENFEEIPSPAVYDTEQQVLYFHQSGIYTLSIRLYYNHRPGVLFECQIPVEAR